jgi:hypothetical protein
MSTESVRADLEKRLTQFLTDPHIQVEVVRAPPKTVVGEIERPARLLDLGTRRPIPRFESEHHLGDCASYPGAYDDA